MRQSHPIRGCWDQLDPGFLSVNDLVCRLNRQPSIIKALLVFAVRVKPDALLLSSCMTQWWLTKHPELSDHSSANSSAKTLSHWICSRVKKYRLWFPYQNFVTRSCSKTCSLTTDNITTLTLRRQWAAALTYILSSCCIPPTLQKNNNNMYI